MPATRNSSSRSRQHEEAPASLHTIKHELDVIDKKTVHRVPLVTHDYRADPRPFPALMTEQGVFTTPPYSAEIKGLWKFKDEETARGSAGAIWERFEGYRDRNDFVGMDISRKFIQMGRTRSLRYALRPGGKKYNTDADGHREAMQRTGKVYDDGKLKGANVFEGYLDRCWADEEYKRAFERWRKGERWSGTDSAGDDNVEDEEVQEEVKLEKMGDDEAVKREPGGGDPAAGEVSGQREKKVKQEPDT